MEELQTQPAVLNETDLPKGSWKEWILAGLLWVWGYLFACYPPLAGQGIQVTLLELGAAGLMLLYLFLTRKSPMKNAWLWLAVMVLSSLSFSLFENSLIHEPLFLLQFGLFALWLLHAAAPAPFQSADLWNGLALLIVKPFTDLGKKWTALFSVDVKSRRMKGILIGVLITLPVLAAATVLLMGADERFSNILTSLAGSFADGLTDFLLKGVAAAVIGAYLLSMLLSAAYTKRLPKPRIHSQDNPAALSILIGALSLLYLAFIAVQGQSFLRIWNGGPQGAAFYSEMARGGFFQLCLVALLNLGVFVCAPFLVKEKTLFFRILLTVLGVLTLLIIVTAVAKMAIYMDLYGLTLLRVHTTWFMASLFLAFGVLVAAQWARLPVFKWIATLVLVSVLAVSYANIGGLVARVNVDRYLSGSLSRFEVGQYATFAYEAAPELIRLAEEAGDEEVKNMVLKFLSGWTDPAGDGWERKSVQRLMAEAQLRDFASRNEPK